MLSKKHTRCLQTSSAAERGAAPSKVTAWGASASQNEDHEAYETLHCACCKQQFLEDLSLRERHLRRRMIAEAFDQGEYLSMCCGELDGGVQCRLFNWLVRRVIDQVFNRVDYNNDGRLDPLEIEIAILHVYNIINRRLPGWQNPPTRKQIQTALAVFDVDGNGTLDKWVSSLDFLPATAMMGRAQHCV